MYCDYVLLVCCVMFCFGVLSCYVVQFCVMLCILKYLRVTMSFNPTLTNGCQFQDEFRVGDVGTAVLIVTHKLAYLRIYTRNLICIKKV